MRLDAGDIQHVCITARHHPLCGQTFPVLQRRLKRGELHLIIQLPTGTTQLIPAHWTTLTPQSITAVAPLLTSHSLRALTSMVALLQNVPRQEATNDPLVAARALDDIQSPDPAPAGRSVDPVAPPSSPEPEGTSDWRRP
jgi:Family of unknown function (DUF5372)